MTDSLIKTRFELTVNWIARFGIPSIYILEFVFWLALMGAFFGTMSFLGAVPAHSFGNSVPAGWEAVVHNHGQLIRWYLKDNHPVAFGLTVLVFLTSLVGMVLVHIAEARIRTKGAGNSEKIALVALLAGILLTSYWVMTRHGRNFVVPSVSMDFRPEVAPTPATTP